MINCYSTDGERFRECNGVMDALDESEYATHVGEVEPIDLDVLADATTRSCVEDVYQKANEHLFEIVGEAAEDHPSSSKEDDAVLHAELTGAIRRWLEGRVACWGVKNIREITQDERDAWLKDRHGYKSPEQIERTNR